MKRFLFVSCVCMLSATAFAYTINGKYFRLEKCQWEKLGYEYGYMGYYVSSDGERVSAFFGSKYCEY